MSFSFPFILQDSKGNVKGIRVEKKCFIRRKGGKLRVYLTGDHKFPKRIGESILAYYANNNVVILRKPVKRAILPQNIAIKNNQPYLCALWQGMDLPIKSLFADYAKIYKINTRQKRTQGVSAFSMFIYFVYRAQKRYGTLIKDMSIEFIMSIFKQFNSLAKLMKGSLLYSLGMRVSSQNVKFVSLSKTPLESKKSLDFMKDNDNKIDNKEESEPVEIDLLE